MAHKGRKQKHRRKKIKTECDEILRRVDSMPILDSRSADEILGYDEHGLPESSQSSRVIEPGTSAAKWPDFAARIKEIFGDRVLGTGDNFLKYRHREWELAMETDPPLPKKTRPTEARRPPRLPRRRTKG